MKIAEDYVDLEVLVKQENPSHSFVQGDQRQNVEGLPVRFVCDTCGARGEYWQVGGPCWFYLKRGMCDGIIRQVPADINGEKAAIQAARKLRINEIDRLQKEVNTLDARFEQLESGSIAVEGIK